MFTIHQPTGALPGGQQGTGGVLIIDDEEIVRTVLVRMITRLGYCVYEAGTGSDGLAALRELGDALMVMLVDMTMPQMSGVEVARAALSLCPGISVVIMSGHPSEDLVYEHGLAGKVRFLQKPFSFSMVRDLLA